MSARRARDDIVSTNIAMLGQAEQLALAVHLAERLTPEDSEGGAAYRERDVHVGNAWKADPEFGNALHMAYVLGELKWLRDFVTAGKPIPEGNAFEYGELISIHRLVSDLLGSPREQQLNVGRSRRVANERPAAEQAERNAAWLVAFQRKSWLERNGRKRMRGIIMNEMIKAAIKEAAKAFKVPVHAINDRNIRTLLQNRSVVVR